jgi:Flp pilus assembly protein TadB
MLYGPNVLVAMLGALGIFMIILSIMALPHYKLAGMQEEEPNVIKRFQRRLDQADLQISVMDFFKTAALLGLVLGAGGWYLSGAPTAGVFGAFLGFFGYYSYLEDRRDRRRRDYQDGLAEVMDILAESFAAAGAPQTALENVAVYAPPAVKPDFEEMVAMMSSGNMPFLDALKVIADRRRDVIFDRLLEAFGAWRTSGGKIGPILLALGDSVRALTAGRRRVETAQSRIIWEARIVCLAPFAFMVILRQTAGDLQGPFYSSWMGQVAVLLVGFMSALAYYLMNRLGQRAVAPMESSTSIR